MSRSFIHWCAGITAMVMLALPAMGTIDKDADEMSDIWEGEYGFSTTGSATSNEDPGADPDGDGWTNLQESMAGTDPGSSEMPEGVLKTQISQNPSLTGVFTVSWETTPGKYYTLWVSTELDIWTPVGTAMLGDGTPIEMAVSSSGSKLFWRTTAADQDSDGDGLSDFEEWLVGTDSHKTDTDGDGVSDAGEVEQGKSPTDPNDTPTADWFTLVGDKPMDVVKSETRLFTVKKGETRVFVLGTQSDEYPVYTGSPSIFNDTLEWQITPGSGTAITGDINVNDRDLEWALDGANNVTLNGLEPVHVEAVKVIQAPATSDLVVTVTLKGTNISDGTLPSRLIVGVLPVKILPDADMAGTVGDIIASNKGAGGEQHFVTPKATTELPQTHVNLKAKGLEAAWITAGDPNQLVEWVTGVGEADSATPPDVLKWRVKRDAPAKNEVKIRTIAKYGNEVAAKLNVWVVWAELSGRISGNSLSPHNELTMNSNEFKVLGPGVWTLHRETPTISGGLVVDDLKGFSNGIEWCAPISPKLIVAKDSDIPELNQLWPRIPATEEPQGRAYYALWDFTRDKKLKITKDGTVIRDDTEWNTDDSQNNDKDSNPYDGDNGDPSGEIFAVDGPGVSTTVSKTDGVLTYETPGNSYIMNHVFHEWVRVKLVGKWYDFSDKKDWYSNVSVIKENGEWKKNGETGMTIGIGIQGE